jgi:hypothetical protein
VLALTKKIILWSREQHRCVDRISYLTFALFALVSYKEFLQLFRRQRQKQISKLDLGLTEKEPGDENLIGLDAHIPGGMYDDSVDPKYKSFSSGRPS